MNILRKHSKLSRHKKVDQRTIWRSNFLSIDSPCKYTFLPPITKNQIPSLHLRTTKFFTYLIWTKPILMSRHILIYSRHLLRFSNLSFIGIYTIPNTISGSFHIPNYAGHGCQFYLFWILPKYILVYLKRFNLSFYLTYIQSVKVRHETDRQKILSA